MLIINQREIGPAPMATAQQATLAHQVVATAIILQALLLII